MDYSSGKFRQSDIFSRTLKQIRRFVVPVMKTVIDRMSLDYTPDGWIDMKIDPENGADRYHLNHWYNKRNIYSWIQGRGLETIAGYIEWINGLKGYNLLDVNTLHETGDRLYRKLLPLLPDFSKGGDNVSSIPFVFIDETGFPPLLDQENRADSPGISDLFVARGIVAYGNRRGFTGDLKRSMKSLRYIVDTANSGNLINDQITYEPENRGKGSSNKIGLEGPMLSIGAAFNLYQASRKKDDLLRGFAAIERILTIHTINIEPYGKMILDYVEEDGSPHLENGILQNNPGHALEIVGLALEFLRKLPRELCTEEELSLCSSWKRTLKELGFVHLRLGRSETGTIILKVQSRDGKPVKAVAPWWSSFEAVRTASEMLAAAESIEENELLRIYIVEFMNSIDKIYIKPSRSGIPVQNVDLAGNIVSLIPATPDIDPGYHTGIPLFDAYEILSGYSGLLCGMGASKLSLKLGKPLQGHIARKKPAEAVMDPLFVRSCWLETAYNRTLFISCDILELDLEWTDALYEEIETSFGIKRSHIIISTTHTHTGPCVLNLGSTRRDSGFLPVLKHSVIESVRKSFDNMIPVSVVNNTTVLSGIGVNRRKPDPESGRIVMRPNHDGEQDDSLTTICFISGSGEIYGIMVNISIHPTTLGVGIAEYSGDYPGRIISHLHHQYKELEVIILQGACGDVRPAVMNSSKTEFIDGTEEDIERMGGQISDSISSLITKSLKEYSSGIGTCGMMYTNTSSFELPLGIMELETLKEIKSGILTQKELESAETADRDSFAAAHDDVRVLLNSELSWAETEIDKLEKGIITSTVRAEFSICVLCETTVIIAIPGEAFSRIGLNIREMLDDYTVLICGYGGGTVGYIPTQQACIEGGYEVERAYRLYGLPAPLKKTVEENVYNAVRSLMEEYSEQNS